MIASGRNQTIMDGPVTGLSPPRPTFRSIPLHRNQPASVRATSRPKVSIASADSDVNRKPGTPEVRAMSAICSTHCLRGPSNKPSADGLNRPPMLRMHVIATGTRLAAVAPLVDVFAQEASEVGPPGS